MARRDLQLNSISRFTKSSTRYTLEVHDHCEVPAGCGGVVLRWLNPRRAIPVLLQIYSEKPGVLLIDGAQLESSRPLLALGPHVLALHWEAVKSSQSAFLFAASVGGATSLTSTKGAEVAASIWRSQADGTWRYTTHDPAHQGWAQRDFDDSAWKELRERDVPPPPKPSPQLYRYNELRKLGPKGLGVHKLFASPLWVRRKFDLTPEGIQ